MTDSLTSAPTQLSEDRPRWRVFVANTRTGVIIKRSVPFVGVPHWSCGINEYGSWSVDVPLGGIAVDDLRSLLDFWRWSWGIAWGSYILQCGPVITAAFDDSDATVKVAGGGLWSILNKRRVVASTWAPPASIRDELYDVNLTGLSLHTIGKRLVQTATARANCALPIVLPTDITGSAERNYPGYDLASVGERLQQLTQVESGPEIEFRPRWTDSGESAVEWVYRSGNPRLGLLDYPHAWDYGKALTRMPVDLDGSRLTTSHITRGNGTERLLLYGHAADTTLPAAGWPPLEDSDSEHQSAEDQATLDGHARAYVATYGRQIETWQATVRIDGTDALGRPTRSPSLDRVAAGDNGTFSTTGHRFLTDKLRQARVLGVESGETLGTAKLTLQETP